MSYNFNNNKIYSNEQFHINNWKKQGVLLIRNNQNNKYAPDCIYQNSYLDIKDSNDFNKYEDFRFDVVSYHNYNQGQLENSCFTTVNKLKNYLLTINPRIKLGTLFQDVKYQSVNFNYKGKDFLVIIDLDVIRKYTFKLIDFKVNDKRKYNLNDNYASAFICINKDEVKQSGAIHKWMQV